MSSSRSNAVFVVCFALSGLACSSGSGAGSALDAGGETGTNVPEAGTNVPTPDPPHALGTISLGESHASGGGASRPFVSAVFVPDAASTKSCDREVAGCRVRTVPKCGDQGCPSGEFCAFDDACKAVCKPTCGKSCPTGEVCVKQGGEETCTKATSFDAGPIAFSGTTTAITLFPPYSYEADAQGAPYLPGATIKVQAQGAAEAGFEAFAEEFTATTFVQTSPKLSELPRAKVFGTDPLPVAWVAGKDAIQITIAGARGGATCDADDATGKFDLPRAVVDAVLEDDATFLSVSVARVRKETRKGKKTKGSIPGVTIQPDGWLDLVTSSTESASFQGCPGGGAICGDQCVDVKNDRANCGGCGKVCAGECTAGKCLDCDGCLAKAQATGGACKATRDACLADAACKALDQCLLGCGEGTSCQRDCQSKHSAGTAKLQPFIECLSTTCAQDCQL
jgi:hypothetical protein